MVDDKNWTTAALMSELNLLRCSSAVFTLCSADCRSDAVSRFSILESDMAKLAASLVSAVTVRWPTRGEHICLSFFPVGRRSSLALFAQPAHRRATKFVQRSRQ